MNQLNWVHYYNYYIYRLSILLVLIFHLKSPQGVLKKYLFKNYIYIII